MTQETLNKAINLKNDCDRVNHLLTCIKRKKDDVTEDYFEITISRLSEVDKQLLDTMIKWLQDKGIELREEIEKL